DHRAYLHAPHASLTGPPHPTGVRKGTPPPAQQPPAALSAATPMAGPVLAPRGDPVRSRRNHHDVEHAERLRLPEDHAPPVGRLELVRRGEPQLPTPNLDLETRQTHLHVEHPVRAHRDLPSLTNDQPNRRLQQLDLRRQPGSF